MNNNTELAELLFPHIKNTVEYYEELYPSRKLPDGAQVTRIAPSPTGFIHLGNLFGALTDERIAHQSGGVFYLRIEDTDNKRKVEGAVETVISAMKYFCIDFDEGAEIEPEGCYGPYYQRRRAEIYQTYAKSLVERGFAYPCFCTEEELEDIRLRQTAEKQNPGYYGKWAKCSDLSADEVKEKLAAGCEYVIRLRAMGYGVRKFLFVDKIKGMITVLENDQDIVLLKRDGIPTYHFAHVIDDHLMRTTLVVRGEEWLASLPIHLQLFEILGFELPEYAHTAQLMKLEDGRKRKLSKRLDPELSLEFYKQLGYHPLAVKTYLLTLLNSNFEEWYIANPDKSIEEFPFSLAKMSISGALFDLMKLNDVSKNVFAAMEAQEAMLFFGTWLEEYKPDEYKVIFADREKLLRIFELGMGIGSSKRRKDFISADQIFGCITYYFDEYYKPASDFGRDNAECREILLDYLSVYSHCDDSTEWFDKIKGIAVKHGYAEKLGLYKKNPDAYKGYVGDVAEIIRIAVTGEKNTPDLRSIMQLIGENSVRERISSAIGRL